MAEFWWGPSPKSEIRHQGQFYPACRGKCKPILTWMLQGLDVDPNPEETGASHLNIEIIYEDDVLAVINKPSGLLSVPGRTEDHSVATIAMEHWPGSLPVHRLDMGTSGLMVIAKTKEAYVSLQEQFVRRTVKKHFSFTEHQPINTNVWETLMNCINNIISGSCSSCEDPRKSSFRNT